MNSGFDEMDSQRVAKAALKGFFKITESWRLTEQQQRTLLGEPSEQSFRAWKAKKRAEQLDEEILLRISYVLGIFKALALCTQRIISGYFSRIPQRTRPLTEFLHLTSC